MTETCGKRVLKIILKSMIKKKANKLLIGNKNKHITTQKNTQRRLFENETNVPS